MVMNGNEMVPNVCGLVKWRLEIKEKSKLRQILQFCPPLSDFTHLVVPRTCFKAYNSKENVNFKWNYISFKPKLLVVVWKNPGIQVNIAHCVWKWSNLYYFFSVLTPAINEIEELKKRHLEFSLGSKLILASQDSSAGRLFWR